MNSSFRFRRAVVTGCAGFIGTNLCVALLERGASVVGLDNFATGDPANVAELERYPGFRFLRHDVTQPLPEVGATDFVAHLASAASPIHYARLGVQTLKAGADGTAAALELARRHGARLLLASTSEVYGDPAEHPQRETYWGNVNPVGPRSVYDEAKRYAEALVSAYHRDRLADVTIARIFNTYGPGMRADDGRMVPAFIEQVLDRKPLTVTGDGRQTRSICYIDDTVRGLLALAESDHPGPVNIGNPHEMTVDEIAALIRRLGGGNSPIRRIATPADDPRRRCPDIGLARAQLHWEPTVTPEDGLRRTLEWFAARRERAQFTTANAG
ncbi:NAD-dependent epimerase/dehydratase family protein [Nocardia blacklockiae]|uniref:NAD-dependent epimerase/dehydratase family protein n=1 Tax=Nocardia blacklockiae TaxID=480036 RepID=UPI001894DD1E|nr:NAD-dependent epimerase/dehydratase family protein [Nocardia blacklockiae]MBF6175331.1 NAD-dependent epimerase/dehydratase family protein [Nocardia blacklockiae]